MKKINGIEIYENLKEIINPGHSCLVVWDVQNGLASRVFNKVEFISDLKNLLNILRGKMPIVYTLITPPEKEFRSSWSYYAMMRRFGVEDPSKLPEFMAKGSNDRNILQDITPQTGDILLEKPTASIFTGTYFEQMMKNRNIKTLIFTGIATEIGIESSARDAANRGFYPVIATDCVSSMDKEAHNRSLENMQKMFICESSQTIAKNV
ncbi:MAG: cysteine hydrolase [Candidatus Acididesulfobacter diazotrophicus]|jgi:nicotinamidase-related amidase|uniref:Cysteine hydrolase n=1 Tax=Candidatus Acididesulfobacter diazotrophicus TaxID=2597226 RepID=A0A519BLJ4_9DELT|nr:MAG: cysteine hydrolase [Candidatus Acididesulfobacter diazotrophicus]